MNFFNKNNEKVNFLRADFDQSKARMQELFNNAIKFGELREQAQSSDAETKAAAEVQMDTLKTRQQELLDQENKFDTKVFNAAAGMGNELLEPVRRMAARAEKITAVIETAFPWTKKLHQAIKLQRMRNRHH